MAVLNLTGFELGNATDGVELSISGTASVSSAIKRTGAYSGRVNPTTTGIGLFSLGGITTAGAGTTFSVASLYTQFYFRYAVKPAANSEVMYSSGSGSGNSIFVRLNSGGNLEVYGNTTLEDTGATVLAQDTWYQIRINVNSADDSYVLQINGATELSGTLSVDVGTLNNATFGKNPDYNGNSVDFYYDDCICDDSAFPSGDVKILGISPTANGSTMSWSAGTGASDYTQVNEIPGSDAEYVQCPTTGNPNIAYFALQDCATVGISGTILSLLALIRTRENITATSATKLSLKSGATASETTTRNGTTGASTQKKVFNTDPNTSAPWTTAGLDAVEFGAIENNAVAVRCSMVFGSVAFIEPLPLSTGNFFQLF